jgi:hypothetical protein
MAEEFVVDERSGRHEPGTSDRPTRDTPAAIAPSDRELLHGLWSISHFGWIAQATICRTLIISGAHETLASDLGDRLRHLRNRGWVEQRDNDGETDERERRLTDSGRDVLVRHTR